jgi:uncharacterized protein YcbK (DUF882 family)
VLKHTVKIDMGMINSLPISRLMSLLAMMDQILIDSNLVDLLQDIRDHFKRSVVLNSGYRTVGYNRRIGGASNSFHTQGMAADFNVAGYSPQAVRRIIESKVIKGVDPEKIGLGSYANFTHIDCRGYRSRW